MDFIYIPHHIDIVKVTLNTRLIDLIQLNFFIEIKDKK